jgi:hypothetical protein
VIVADEISVHDNFLVSYEVLCERRKLRLCTEYRDGGEPYEITDVTFSGVVAYDFRHDSEMGTIIFDIAEVPGANIYTQHCDQFRAGLNYGWPGQWAESAESAERYFQQHSIRGFEVSSSCGMDGWILAREMQKTLRR